MRVSISLSALILAPTLVAMLAGCADPGGPPPFGAPKAAKPAKPAILGFSMAARTLASGEFVEVEIVHRSLNHRVEQVALVAPTGARTRATDVRTERVRVRRGGPYPGGWFGVAGGSGGHFSTGVGIGITFPIGSLFRNPTYRTRALVRVPDPAGYRANTKAWKVAVVMGYRLGEPKTIERPAPAVR